MKKRLFWDMDGVLAEWQEGTPLEEVCEEGYFENLPPNPNMVSAIMQMYAARKEYDVELYILSAVFEDAHSIKDKNLWLDKYVPFIDSSHRLFVSCEGTKAESAALQDIGGVGPNDFLLDDYTKNIQEWKASGGHPIKVFNGVNGRSSKFCGDYTCTWLCPDQIIHDILKVMEEH